MFDVTFKLCPRQTAEETAIEERVASHTVGIASRHEETIGTGVLLSHCGRVYVLTAAHVIRGIPLDELCFFRAGGNLPRIRFEERTNCGMTWAQQIPVIRSHRHPKHRKIDIAALEVDGQLLQDGYCFPFERLGQCVVPGYTHRVVSIGYPASLGRVVAPGSLAACSCIYWTRVRLHLNIGGFDPWTHFVVHFEPDFAHELEPLGFSGAGVWYQGDTGRIWEPSPRIAGLVIRYVPRVRMLECLRADVLRDFVVELPR